MQELCKNREIQLNQQTIRCQVSAYLNKIERCLIFIKLYLGTYIIYTINFNFRKRTCKGVHGQVPRTWSFRWFQRLFDHENGWGSRTALRWSKPQGVERGQYRGHRRQRRAAWRRPCPRRLLTLAAAISMQPAGVDYLWIACYFSVNKDLYYIAYCMTK